MKSTLLALALFSAVFAHGTTDYPYRAADLTNVTVTGGFWLPRIETNRVVTLPVDFRKCTERGFIANFEEAGARKWGTFRGIRFYDADIFKLIEGASYTLLTHPNPKLAGYLDELIKKIARAQEPDGYLYTARTLGVYKPWSIGATRWSALYTSHELFNMGELLEAAVAHHEATGKTNLLEVARRTADLITRTFGSEPTQLKDVPGHEGPELAFCRFYRLTGDERYLRMAKFFVDQRGAEGCHRKNCVEFVKPQDVVAKSDATLPGAYDQCHRLVVDQKEAVGHAVRAAYLYCGMMDVAALTGDARYAAACDALWQNVVGRKMHVTGGIGARHDGEAFGADYELPNEMAYLETCAALANALWNQRLFLYHGDAKYVDVLERVLYNGFLSGISFGGDEFFYENPLASKGGYGRKTWFGCPCCPSNVVRLFPQIGTLAYATRGDAAYVNLFIDSAVRLALAGGEIALKQTTDYPWKGASRVVVTPAKAGQRFALNVRIPGWCVGRPVPSDLYTQVAPGTSADFSVQVNGEAVATDAPQKGYCVIDRAWKAGDVVEIAMAMPVRRIRAHEKVEADRGRVAVERGPIVYCAEGVDNGGTAFDAKLPPDAAFEEATVSIRGVTLPSLRADSLTLIPYFAWCHRGAGEMQTWFSTAVSRSSESSAAKALATLKAVAQSPNYYWAWTGSWLNHWDRNGDMRNVVEENGVFKPKPLADVTLVCDYQKYADGRRALISYADLASVVGTWHSPRYYAVNRAGLTAAIRKQWAELGGLAVFSWHMDQPYCTNGFPQAAYRFKSEGANRNVVRQILDGTGEPCGAGAIDGKTHRAPFKNPREWYLAQLKDIADFLNGLVDASGKKIPVVLRYPHEADGTWFWWGESWCTAEEFRALCRMEADYLRKACGPDQILFAYTPDKAWTSFGKEGDAENTFLARYPGDAYVDIVGVDDYSIGNGRTTEEAERNLEKAIGRLREVSSFAEARGLVACISESGGKGKRDDFWQFLHRAATADGVKVAFVDTWSGVYGTTPETLASEEDERAFARRPQVLMEGASVLPASGRERGLPSLP